MRSKVTPETDDDADSSGESRADSESSIDEIETKQSKRKNKQKPLKVEVVAVKSKDEDDKGTNQDASSDYDSEDESSDSDSDSSDSDGSDEEGGRGSKKGKAKEQSEKFVRLSRKKEATSFQASCCAGLTYYTPLANVLIGLSALYSLLFFPLLVLGGQICIVSEHERALIFRAGKARFGQKVAGPGAYWLLPCVDKVRKVDMRRQAIAFTTRIKAVDRKWFMIDWLIFIAIDDPLAAILGTRNPRRSTQQLALGVCRAVAAARYGEEIAEEREGICAEVKRQLAEAVAEQWGVRVEVVEMQDVHRILDPRNRKRQKLKKQAKKYRADDSNGNSSKPGSFGGLPSVRAPWKALRDPSSGQVYYHDTATGRTQWAHPG